MTAKYQDMRHIYYENSADNDKVKDVLNARYHSEATVRLPFSIGKYPAFVMLNPELASLTASIYQANTRLEILSATVPSEAIDQFRRKMIIEEIQQTNEVENVHSTRQEIRDAMSAIDEGRTGERFEGMVRKYAMIMSENEIPLQCCSDIRTLYDEFILDEVLRENAQNKPDGIWFRKEATSVYSGYDQKIHDGLVPEEKIIEVMEKALTVLNDDSLDILIRVAIFHYAFAYIHPFYDGNGRMTRFISSYVLSKHFDKSACLRIAFVIKDHRNLYYKMFKNANDKRAMGDLTSFVTEFLRFFKQSIEDSNQTLKESKLRYDRYLSLLKKAIDVQCPGMQTRHTSLLKIMLQEELFGYPRYSLEKIAYILECTPKTARTLLTKCGPLVSHHNEGRKFWWHINLDEVERIGQY